MDLPKLSENIGGYEAGEYFVTAARWTSYFDHTGFDSFEIGIRRKSDAKFWLLQSRKWNRQSVQEMANAIAHLLSIKTENYDPDWCQEYLAGE